MITCLLINLETKGIELNFSIVNKLALRPSSRSWLLYAISSDIEATWASNDENAWKTILFLNKFFFKIAL